MLPVDVGLSCPKLGMPTDGAVPLGKNSEGQLSIQIVSKPLDSILKLISRHRTVKKSGGVKLASVTVGLCLLP